MADLSTIVSFLGGLGAGSVLSALVQHFLSKRVHRADLLFKERNEVFQGLLQALENLEVKDSVENAKRFAFWAARAEIIASSETYKAIEHLKTTKPYGEERRIGMDAMLQNMRKDLDIL